MYVKTDVLPLPYIIIGIPVGACIAIFIGVLVFIFIRRIKKKGAWVYNLFNVRVEMSAYRRTQGS